MATVAKAGPVHSWEPGTSGSKSMCHGVGPPSAAFPQHEQGSWTGSDAASTGTAYGMPPQ